MKGLAALLLLAALAWTAPACAQGDPKMALEDIPLDLGPVQRFPNPVAAQRHCPDDVVVWADPATGYYHDEDSPRFAAARAGFTCMSEAAGAGYWNTNPFAGGTHLGRSFPIDPALRPNTGT